MIAPNEIKVCYLQPDVLQDVALIKHYLSAFDADELNTYANFRFAKDRHTYLVAHALLRGALSRYAGSEPGEWAFRRNANNKPFILKPEHAGDLQFNLSHTQGMVAVAITRMGQVGIDVECLNRDNTSLDIAMEILSEDEYSDFIQHKENYKRLLDYWTLKEAFVKATGLGLTSGLKNHAFDLSEPNEPKIRFLTPNQYSSRDWKFWQNYLHHEYLLAVACHMPEKQDIRLDTEEALWLLD